MSDHWYDRSGAAQHFIKKKDGSGNRPTNVWDARKNDWLPSPTTVLKRVLAAPALEQWKIRQGIHAVMTAPRLPNEDLDAFITRVIDEERQHEQESEIARDRGQEIHDAIQIALTPVPMEEIEKPSKCPWDERLNDFVVPVCDAVLRTGSVIALEKILVNEIDGYAGKVDCATENEECVTISDFKTSRTLPKKDAYDEHKMQVAAYAKAFGTTGDKRIECQIIYISKNELGAIKVCPVIDWQFEFQKFKLLLHYFVLANGLNLPKSLEAALPF